jgi:hypothetical protein
VIPVPSDVKVWLASGVTDMRRGMNGWLYKCSRYCNVTHIYVSGENMWRL